MTGENIRVCGAIVDRQNVLRFIDIDSNESRCWQIFLGWPDNAEIEDAKKRGYRFRAVTVDISGVSK